MAGMQKVARLAEIPENHPFAVKLADESMILIRIGSDVRAFAGKCPHAGAPLDEGAICNGRLICPWHKGSFAITDGALLDPPALEGLRRYPTRIEADAVLVSPEAEPPLPRSVAGDDHRVFVVVGAGAAGTAGACALREAGFAGRLLLIGPEPPYDRTVLSKFVVSGEMPVAEIPPLRDDATLAALAIERVVEEAVRLDASDQKVVLSNGQAIFFDAALIATGGMPRRPEIPGANGPRVHVLRNREDAAAIHEALKARGTGAHAVLLGGGFIGMEAASAFRTRGVAVTVVTSESAPFTKQIGPAAGGRLLRLHEENGVVFRKARKAVAIADGPQDATLMLDDGESLTADLVLLGLGIRPRTDFVEGIKLGEDGGLAVDTGLRAAPAIYAAGDIAAMPLGGEARRIEHWRYAQQQARLAARNMLGAEVSYDDVPFFWTQHYGHRVECLGDPRHWDEEIVLGDLGGLTFVVLLAKDGEVRAAVACQRERAMAVLSDRMRRPLPVAEAQALIMEC
jgi:apoptosis-inducing factor 3